MKYVIGGFETIQQARGAFHGGAHDLRRDEEYVLVGFSMETWTDKNPPPTYAIIPRRVVEMTGGIEKTKVVGSWILFTEIEVIQDLGAPPPPPQGYTDPAEGPVSVQASGRTLRVDLPPGDDRR